MEVMRLKYISGCSKSTREVRRKYVWLKNGKSTVKYGKSTVLYGNFFLAPTVPYNCLYNHGT